MAKLWPDRVKSSVYLDFNPVTVLLQMLKVCYLFE